MKTQAILLAAGESKRYDGIKQLAQIYGQAMLDLSIDNFLSNNELLTELDRLIVVLGANADVIQKQLQVQLSNNIVTFQVSEWQQGMGRSISAVVAQLDPEVTHVLIGLADQIAIKTENFRLLLNTSKHQPDKIICAHYANKLAVPAIFPRKYFPQLIALFGDSGAKKLLQAHHEQVIPIAMPKAAIDIDNKEDLRKWLLNSQ